MARSSDDQPDSYAFRLDSVRYRWPGKQGFEISVKSLEVGRGGRLLLLGPSGAGKSTLLSILRGIVVPQSGSVHVLGQNFAAMNAIARDWFRAEHYGIIFQMFNLLPYASAVDNVLLPLSFSEVRRKRATQHRTARAEGTRLLEELAVDGSLATKGRASQLSIGQQQRVAAARALIGGPEIIVADEPTSALDHRTEAMFIDLLFKQLDDAGATLVMVSHDSRLSSRFNTVINLSDIADIRRHEAA